MVDPWVSLAAAAVMTSRIKLGTWVTPVARRRPWKLARETATLDVLSGGRLILGVGLGSPPVDEFDAFGEDSNDRVRAEKLDEGLDLLARFWSGEPVDHAGKHFRVENATFLPKPAQEPRIPVWVGGNWPNKNPFRRAARWDGVTPLKAGAGWDVMMSPEELRDLVDFIAGERGNREFEVAFTGQSPAGAGGRDVVAPYQEAGATWWLEGCHHRRGKLEDTRARITVGPPK